VERQIETKTRRRAEAVSESDDDALPTLAAAGLRLQAGEDRWRVSGKTLTRRRLLRDAGGSWNKLDQCWEFSGDDPTARLAAALEAQPASSGHNSGEATGEKPHYWGHRGRVRERALKAGVEPLAD
jgi:DNA repair protein RadC